MAAPPKEYTDLCESDLEFCLKNEFRIRSNNPATGAYALMPLCVNDEQRQFLHEVVRQMETQGFVRIIVCKSRKLGFSTIIQALIVHQCVFNEQTYALTMAHQDKATRELFLIGRTIVESLTPGIGAKLRYKPKANNIEWVNGSRAICQTQGGSANSERGSTPNIVHISELPSWDESRKNTDAADVAQSVLNAVFDVPGTMIFIESTAKGTGNLFHKMFMRGINQEDGFNFVPMFFGWQRRDEFTIPAESPKHAREQELKAEMMEDAYRDEDRMGALSMATELGYTQLQLDRAMEYGLKPPQVRFWQNVLINKCDGDQDRFDSEWPLSWSIAFISSGRPVFSIRRIQERKEELRNSPALRANCTLRKDAAIVEFIQDGGGVGGGWRVFEHPRAGHTYLVSADAAGGGTTPDDDYSAIQVLDRVTKRFVATYYAKIYPDLLGHQVAYACELYNGALAVPESNKEGLLTINVLLKEHPYTRIYRRFVEVGKVPTGNDRKYIGYSTNDRTRHFAVSNFAKEWRLDAIEIFDVRHLNEMMGFIRSKTSGRPEAGRGNNDDLIIAACIALDVDQQQAKQGVPVKANSRARWEPAVNAVRPFNNTCPRVTDETSGDGTWY